MENMLPQPTGPTSYSEIISNLEGEIWDLRKDRDQWKAKAEAYEAIAQKASHLSCITKDQTGMQDCLDLLCVGYDPCLRCEARLALESASHPPQEVNDAA